jgi:hypothetical protein
VTDEDGGGKRKSSGRQRWREVGDGALIKERVACSLFFVKSQPLIYVLPHVPYQCNQKEKME